LGVHGLNKLGLKTQRDRTHTHGLSRSFRSKPNPTATLEIFVFELKEHFNLYMIEYNLVEHVEIYANFVNS
jgi:hypothetical protein